MGLRRTPRAHRNPGEVFGVPNLAQHVFAAIPGEVQVHQDQVWNGRIRIGPIPANESECFAAVGQVSQLKPQILLMQSPLEKEDIRTIVLNHENPGRRNNRGVFQAYFHCRTIAADLIHITRLPY